MPKKKKLKKITAKKTKKPAKKKVLKVAKKVKAKIKAKLQVIKAPKEKLLGRVEHFFDKISVAAISVKAPFAVGDVIHIKGHTTDFVQPINSLQMEHQDVQKVKKGDDIGIKVKELVRQHDFVYLSNEKALAAVKLSQTTVQPIKAKVVQQPMFPALPPQKPAASAPAKPFQAVPIPKPVQPKPQAQPKADPYENKKFFSF
jgi:hypothetical protein